MKKRLVFLLGLVMLLVLAACGNNEADTASSSDNGENESGDNGETYELQFGMQPNTQSNEYEAAEFLADYVEEESNGQLTISRSEEHTSELQSRFDLVCRLLLEKYCTPRYLHSFPTRRSSDLGNNEADTASSSDNGENESGDNGETYELQFGMQPNTQSNEYEAAEFLADYVEEESNGQLTIS